jgi:hypothetical protein
VRIIHGGIFKVSSFDFQTFKKINSNVTFFLAFAYFRGTFNLIAYQTFNLVLTLEKHLPF